MNNQEDLKRIVGQYGQAAVAVMKQIADYLKVLQVERPELFVNGVLVNDWVARLQEKPLEPEVLPKPEPIVEPVFAVSPVAPNAAETVNRVIQSLQKAMSEFGANALDVMQNIAAFLTKLQVDRPDLFENGILVADWSTRIQTKPESPLILPIYDPDLIPDTVAEPTKPVVEPVKPPVEPVVEVEPAKPVVVPVLPDVVVPDVEKPKIDPPTIHDPVTTTTKPAWNKEAMKFELDRLRSVLMVLYTIVDDL